MSDPMETGGVGKNPAIDRINNLNAAQNRANAVAELGNRVFRPKSPGAEDVLRRRRQLMEEFHMSFKRKEEKVDANILRERQQRVHTGGYQTHDLEDGRDRITDGIFGRLLPDGRGEKEPLLSGERTAKDHLGESGRSADYRTDSGTENES